MKPELSENKAPKIIQILLDTPESCHWGGGLIGLGDDGALYVPINGVKRWMVYMPPLHKDDAALTSEMNFPDDPGWCMENFKSEKKRRLMEVFK